MTAAVTVPERGSAFTHGSAGWPDNNYWTGEANNASNAFIVNVNNGNDGNNDHVSNDNSFVCGR